MEKIYMTVKREKYSGAKKFYCDTKAEKRISFSFFHAKPEGEQVTEITITPAAESALRSLQFFIAENRYMGRAEFYSAEKGRTLYFHEFMPFWAIDASQRSRHGAATALFLALAEKLAQMHPRATVKFSPNMSAAAISFYNKMSIDPYKPISINDLHAKIKRYHSNARLRELMKRKIEREGDRK